MHRRSQNADKYDNNKPVAYNSRNLRRDQLRIPLIAPSPLLECIKDFMPIWRYTRSDLMIRDYRIGAVLLQACMLQGKTGWSDAMEDSLIVKRSIMMPRLPLIFNIARTTYFFCVEVWVTSTRLDDSLLEIIWDISSPFKLTQRHDTFSKRRNPMVCYFYFNMPTMLRLTQSCLVHVFRSQHAVRTCDSSSKLRKQTIEYRSLAFHSAPYRYWYGWALSYLHFHGGNK